MAGHAVVTAASFQCLTDIAIRWSVMPLDIVGWATDELLALSVIVPPVRIESQLVSGLVNIAGADAFPLFRHNGAASQSIKLLRIRESHHSDWKWITDPIEGISASAADILIARAEIERFEQQYRLFASEAADNGREDKLSIAEENQARAHRRIMNGTHSMQP
jgi:hypothetical protein